ncbi:MAG: hypothetical protein ACJ764_01535 [Solirubrobacteraceae bacterium]
MVLEDDGLRIELPAGWEGRVLRCSAHLVALQAASSSLAPDDDELGAGTVASLAEGEAFLTLVEYLPGSGVEPGRVPFHAAGFELPLDPTRFAALPGLEGSRLQQSFTLAGRAFWLQVVIAGGRLERRRQLPVLDRVLDSLEVAERGQSG